MRAFLFGLLGGGLAVLLALLLAGGGFLWWRAQAPARERAALLRDLDAYAAWYDENTFRRNLGDAYYLPYRDRYIQQHPRLEQYTLWWRDARRKQPGGNNMFVDAVTNALRPEDLRDPAMLDRYFAR
jgi:hypothetical protein